MLLKKNSETVDKNTKIAIGLKRKGTKIEQSIECVIHSDMMAHW